MASVMRLLLVQSPYYAKVAEDLRTGALQAIAAQKETIMPDEITVPGALEIPAAIRICHLAGERNPAKAYDGYIALGCVIRGQTSHYDIVAGQSAQGLMRLACDYGLAIGNGILTCDTREQAAERANPQAGDKGGHAARACLALAALAAEK